MEFIILLKTKEKNPKAVWSVDFVVAPDNKYGDEVLKDAALWMKLKLGQIHSTECYRRLGGIHLDKGA